MTLKPCHPKSRISIIGTSFKLQKAFARLLIFGLGFFLSGEPGWGEENPTPNVQAQVGAYALQLNAFKAKKNADRFFDSLEAKGIKPYMISTIEDAPWYKVRLGPFSSHAQAVERAEEIKIKYGLASLIVWTMTDTTPQLVKGQAGPLKEKTVVKEAKPSAAVEPKPQKELVSQSDSVDRVVSRFLTWIKAWEEIDLDSYFAFYSEGFESPGVSREKWMKSRKKALSQVRRIKIEVDEVTMNEKGDTIEMAFVQKYWSNLGSEISRKTLVWKNEQGQWKIVKEISQPM